jgi:hypothetical protein
VRSEARFVHVISAKKNDDRVYCTVHKPPKAVAQAAAHGFKNPKPSRGPSKP